MTRAEKFIADNPLFVRHGKEVVAPFEIMALLLEKYHQLCLPTDEEMDECYRNPANEPEHYFRAMLEKFRDGVRFCRYFVREEPKKEKLICCGCGQEIPDNAIFENNLSFHNESCIRMLRNMGEFMFGKPKAVDYKVSPTEKRECSTCRFKPGMRMCSGCDHGYTHWQPKEPTLEDEINALKEPVLNIEDLVFSPIDEFHQSYKFQKVSVTRPEQNVFGYTKIGNDYYKKVPIK